MRLFTVINNETDPGFNLLRLSCAVNDLDLSVLVYKNEYPGHRIKDELLKRYLVNHVPDDEIIFFTDGNDTLLMSSEEEILEKYSQTGKEIIFSAEILCWPDESLASRYPETSTPYRYLNSGGFIGRAGAIKGFLEDDLWSDKQFEKSNQYLWAKRFLQNPDTIGLDSACDIFHAFSAEFSEQQKATKKEADETNDIPYETQIKSWFNSNYMVKNGRVYINRTGSWPCQVHFNGPSRPLMDADMIDMVFSKVHVNKPVRFYKEVM